MRRFIIDNALMWLRDFHVDGLRLDAVHALQDSSPAHLLAELSARGRRAARPARAAADADRRVRPQRPDHDHAAAGRRYGLDAQWDDDVHHALHALLTGERQGYYCDFGSLAVLAKVLTRGVPARRHVLDVPRAGCTAARSTGARPPG